MKIITDYNIEDEVYVVASNKILKTRVDRIEIVVASKNKKPYVIYILDQLGTTSLDQMFNTREAAASAWLSSQGLKGLIPCQ